MRAAGPARVRQAPRRLRLHRPRRRWRTRPSRPHLRPVAIKPIRPDVTGVVLGGGDVGPAGAVVWLKRLDGRTPPVAPTSGRFITQRKKVFLPHVLVVPKGSTVEFRNEDAIYHNAFSLDKPNDFDAGIRAKGNTYSRTFEEPGPVEILCNIHASMNAFVVVVDSPYFTKTHASGTFTHRQGSPRTIRAVRVARDRVQHHPQEDLGRRRWRKRHLGVRRGGQEAESIRARQVRAQAPASPGVLRHGG